MWRNEGPDERERVGSNGNERRIWMYAERAEVKKMQNCEGD